MRTTQSTKRIAHARPLHILISMKAKTPKKTQKPSISCHFKTVRKIELTKVKTTKKPRTMSSTQTITMAVLISRWHPPVLKMKRKKTKITNMGQIFYQRVFWLKFYKIKLIKTTIHYQIEVSTFNLQPQEAEGLALHRQHKTKGKGNCFKRLLKLYQKVMRKKLGTIIDIKNTQSPNKVQNTFNSMDKF